MEKVDGLINKGGPATAMDLWEKAINDNKNKNEERQGIMDRGQRATKTETENKVDNHECQTCASRRYMDRSDDGSVSFQSPTHISPQQSHAAVSSHEQEHVTNENARAQKENREVISSSVSIHYATCPECGVRYAAGGETRTVTKSKDGNEEDQDLQEMLGVQNRRGEDEGKGKVVNTKA